MRVISDDYVKSKVVKLVCFLLVTIINKYVHLKTVDLKKKGKLMVYISKLNQKEGNK
jgi:hypothetical protein